MSKTFVFKRNRSEDVWKPAQSSPSSRRKASLPRASSGGFYQSEFPLQDSLSRESPAMSSPRRRNSASPALSPAGQRRPQRHRDLKRKFIFDLHDEIKKPVHTTPLEEISDMERITSICYGTLHAMMENKHQRKFLHHMNSSHNNSNYSNSTRSSKPPHPYRNPTAAADAPSWDIDVFSANINNNNNSSAPVHEYNISQNFNKYVNKDITDQIKKNKEIMLDEERGRETMANSSHPPPRRKSQIPTSNHSLGSSISRGSESSLKLGLGPSKNNLIDAKKPSKESFARCLVY